MLAWLSGDFLQWLEGRLPGVRQRAGVSL